MKLIVDEKLAYEALGDWVLVERAEESEVTPGGVVLPMSVRMPLREGTVVSVGPGRVLPTGEMRKMTVKVGDYVIVSGYGPQEMSRDGKKYFVQREDDIVTKIVRE